MRRAALVFRLLLPTAFAGPIPRAASAAEPVDVAAFEGLGCALHDDGAVWRRGHFLREDAEPPWTAFRVAPLPPAVSIAVGSLGACATDAQGALRCWGGDLQRSIRRDDGVVALEPFEVEGLPPVSSVAMGYVHACAVADDGSVWRRGENPCGELGCGDRESRAEPVKVELPIPAIAISAGVNNTCAVLRNGQAACRGSDNPTIEGRPFVYETAEPVFMHPDKVGLFSKVANGRNVACGLRRDGRATCWGSNIAGQVGSLRPRLGRDRAAIGDVDDPRGAVDLDADLFYACAATRRGEVRCWGSVTHSARGFQIGPTQSERVSGLPAATRVAAGSDFACAVAEGDVLCWGDPGAIAGMDRRRPVPVPGLPR